MSLDKLEVLAQKLIQLEDDYDAYEFADTYDDYLPNLGSDKYNDVIGDAMSAILNNSYDILNELEDMYYDFEDVDEELANYVLSLMNEVEEYSNYTPTERVNENRLLDKYLKGEIKMNNKFESIIRLNESDDEVNTTIKIELDVKFNGPKRQYYDFITQLRKTNPYYLLDRSENLREYNKFIEETSDIDAYSL